MTAAGSDRYLRKAKEIIQSMRLSDSFPGEAGKDRVITAYLNEIFYGHGAYGVAAAAQIYFGVTDLAKLTPAQAALLAGLPKSPSTLDPYRYAEKDKKGRLVVPADSPPVVRRDWILDGLGEGSARWTRLTPTQIAAAKAEPVVLAGDQPLVFKAAHFTWQVRRQLVSILGDEAAVETGGYTVITTLDWKAQRLAEKWLAAGAVVPNLPRKKGEALLTSLRVPKGDRSWVRALRGKDLHNGAMVALDYRSGDVLAYAGSAGYDRGNLTSAKFSPKFDAAGDGARQPGSAFKPILYAAAFDSRTLTPGSLLLDVTTEFNRAEDWAPRDADQLERGPVLVRKALQYSLNIPAVRALERTGSDRVDRTAEAMGIRFTGGRKAYLQAGLAGALGTVEVRPIDLTSAYGSIANGGVHVPPRMILEIRGPDGTVVWHAPSPDGLEGDLAAGRVPRHRRPRRQHRQGPEPDLGGQGRALQRQGRRAAPGRGQDRHLQRRPRPGHVRVPAAAGGWPAVARGRRLDGQQRPFQPAIEEAGDLADRGRTPVAGLHARVHERLAGDPVRATEGRGQGDHRRLVGRQAGSVDEGDDQGMVHRRHAARRPQGRRPGRPAVQPVLRRLPRGSPQGGARSELLGSGRRRLDATGASGPGRDGSARLANGLLLEAVVVGWLPGRRVRTGPRPR